MGYRIVLMSHELFEQFFVEGATFPTADNQRLRITKGLPEGAKLEAVSMDYRFRTGEVALRFSHPSWPDAPRGEAIPELRIEFESFESTEFRMWMLPGLTAEQRQELMQELQKPA